MQRRTFCKSSLLLTTLLLPLSLDAIAPRLSPLLNIITVQHHLWPTRSGVPTLDEMQASFYLAQMMKSNRYDSWVINYLTKGSRWIDEHAEALFNASFRTLPFSKQAKVIHDMNTKPWGESLLSVILSKTILEPLLAAPIYTNQKEQLGWQWLSHQGGFPLSEKPFWEMRDA